MALDSRDVYALTVYADYLLDHHRAAEVLRLLRGFERVDALYLRFALAAQATGDPGFTRYRADVAARFEAARRQGDRLHLRDASRFASELEHDAARALDFARQNWAVHKTPYDARALLAAAIGCHNPAAARPVIDWMAATRLEDRNIERLIEELRALPRVRAAAGESNRAGHDHRDEHEHAEEDLDPQASKEQRDLSPQHRSLLR